MYNLQDNVRFTMLNCCDKLYLVVVFIAFSECLDVLIISLDQSPLEKYHIPALFYLAETMLYWLRTDAVHQPYLRTGEIKLLKV